MGMRADIEMAVAGIVSQPWSIRDGRVVPTTESVNLAGGAVRLTATMLYADLADSTVLAATYDRRVAAKVYKSFLTCASKLIKLHNGSIRSFDGDRVMAVFVAETPNTDAAMCALKLKWAVDNVIQPKLLKSYESLRDGSYKISHAVGIDTSEVLVVRGGVYKENDLLWIGRAPNIAAKLCSLRGSYRSFITADVYRKLADSAKISSQGTDMWVAQDWVGAGGVTKIYKSAFGCALG